jgi:hypothetical protein
VIEAGPLTCSRAESLEGRLATESGVDTSLVVIDGETRKLVMKVDAVPEERLVEILATKSSDQPLDERMRARYEGDGLEFLDVENSQICAPAMKTEQRVMIGTEVLGKWLIASSLVEHWLGGLASASFYVPYKRIRGWSWEISWLAGGMFSWIIAPWLVAWIRGGDQIEFAAGHPRTDLYETALGAEVARTLGYELGQ